MKHPHWGWLGRKVRMHFLAGVLVVIPIGATAWILYWLFTTIDNILQPVIRLIAGRDIQGVGFGITVVLIYVFGIIASNVGGRKLIQFGESLLARVPVVRPIYTTIKQILEGFSTPSETGFLQVVLIEFPRKGIWTIGFITNESRLQSGEIQLNIFIPTAPNPTSGFLQILKEDEVIRTDIPVDEALKMVISAGKVSPEVVSEMLQDKLDLPPKGIPLFKLELPES